MDCKYYLPCGMCELTKEKCIQYDIIQVPNHITINPDPWRPNENMPITVYGPPYFTPSDVNWEDFTNANRISTSIDEIQ